MSRSGVRFPASAFSLPMPKMIWRLFLNPPANGYSLAYSASGCATSLSFPRACQGERPSHTEHSPDPTDDRAHGQMHHDTTHYVKRDDDSANAQNNKANYSKCSSIHFDLSLRTLTQNVPCDASEVIFSQSRGVGFRGVR